MMTYSKKTKTTNGTKQNVYLEKQHPVLHV